MTLCHGCDPAICTRSAGVGNTVVVRHASETLYVQLRFCSLSVFIRLYSILVATFNVPARTITIKGVGIYSTPEDPQTTRPTIKMSLSVAHGTCKPLL